MNATTGKGGGEMAQYKNGAKVMVQGRELTPAGREVHNHYSFYRVEEIPGALFLASSFEVPTSDKERVLARHYDAFETASGIWRSNEGGYGPIFLARSWQDAASKLTPPEEACH